MRTVLSQLAVLTALVAVWGGPAPVSAQEKAKDHSSHSHDHKHNHASETEQQIHKGFFEDGQIKPRALTDWQGNWQSVYPFVLEGTFDPVFAHKAAHGNKTEAEYKTYYETGFKTDVNRIDISGKNVTFHNEEDSITGVYEEDGYEILTYKKGNRGVRFVFKKTSGDGAAPQFIQFSDHRIAPAKSDHYHLYWGNDRDDLLEELNNWPTYFPAELSGEQIVHEMIAH